MNRTDWRWYSAGFATGVCAALTWHGAHRGKRPGLCSWAALMQYQKELEAIKEEIDPEDTKQIDLEHFLVAFAIKLKETESPEILIDGFKVFDKLNTGFISVAEFRRLMTEIGGQKMELEPVEEMIKVADPDDTGQIVYEPFVRKLLAALAMPPPPPPAPAAKKKKK